MDITDLIQELETAKREAEYYRNRYFKLEEIRNAAAILSSNLDSQEAAEQMLYQAKRFIPFDAAAIRALEEDESTIIASYGLSASALLSYPSTYSPKLLDTSTYTPIILSPTSGPYRSILIVPLIQHNRIVGFIDFLGHAVNQFGPEEQAAAILFSEQAGVAFANALRYTTREQEATTDWLTGLPTRRSFYAKLNRLLFETRPDESAAVLIIDIDHFKLLNDNYGHLFGDSVLISISGAIRETLRAQDICCRYGGEEFLVLLPGSDNHIAHSVAERIRERIEELRFPDKPEVTTSVSIGIYVGNLTTNIHDLIEKADEALYRAKESGRNRVIVYE
ncbi:MAG: sensor domain-containing diguanylate cyclase [Termitinemataceae bacterium]